MRATHCQLLLLVFVLNHVVSQSRITYTELFLFSLSLLSFLFFLLSPPPLPFPPSPSLFSCLSSFIFKLLFSRSFYLCSFPSIVFHLFSPSFCFFLTLSSSKIFPFAICRLPYTFGPLNHLNCLHFASSFSGLNPVPYSSSSIPQMFCLHIFLYFSFAQKAYSPFLSVFFFF